MTSQDKESSNIAPTLTMAQLYEAQEQYFNALKIYKELQDQDYSEEIEDKITSLNEKINKQNKKKLDETIIQIFSEAEIEKFNILASDLYQQFEKTRRDSDNWANLHRERPWRRKRENSRANSTSSSRKY